jgi:outer membrane protein OmpA-like peptidoglycan-associated protein
VPQDKPLNNSNNPTAERVGRCVNVKHCMVAYRNETVTVTGDFLCPECKQQLQEIGTEPRQTILRKALVPGVILLAATTVAGFALNQCRSNPKPDTEQGSTQAPAKQQPGKAEMVAVGATSASPETPPQPVTAPRSEAEIPILPVSDPKTDPQLPITKQTREAVLQRIDATAGLTSAEREKLYEMVERARGFGKIVTIGFGGGRTALSVSDAAHLKNAIQVPNIYSFTTDPSAVFVVLGFSDKTGDKQTKLEISQGRADSVAKVLRDKCGVHNIIHPVGLGDTQLLGPDSSANRVTEVWVALP